LLHLTLLINRMYGVRQGVAAAQAHLEQQAAHHAAACKLDTHTHVYVGVDVCGCGCGCGCLGARGGHGYYRVITKQQQLLQLLLQKHDAYSLCWLSILHAARMLCLTLLVRTDVRY
jgi:hypothetical protein